MQNKNIIRIFLVTSLILLIPLVAMQFNDEVNWGPGDFLIMGILLLGTGFTYEFLARKITTNRNRIIFAAGLLLALFIMWADLAVGIFNIPGFSGS